MIDPIKLLQAGTTDFHTFLGIFFPIVHQGVHFDGNWHIEAMAHQVTQLIVGTNLRLAVSMPPRCLKSYVMSVALPAFLLGRNPAEKIIVVTYAEQLTEDLSAMTQQIMESVLYKRMFPKTVLITRTKRTLKTSAGGKRFATTIGGAITGMGGGWLIVDDPLNASHAYSEVLRQQANSYFDTTLPSRGDTPKTTRMILVAQRLHENDLIGHIQGRSGWRHLKLQARATEDALIDIGGGRQHKVICGDLLHGARLDDAILAQRLEEMGSAAFEAQYQQNPLPVTGNQVKYEWLVRYWGRVPRDNGIVVQSWDTASKTGVANDWSVCTTWLFKNNVSYLQHVWRGRVDFPALKERVVELYHEHGATHLLIEDKSSGMALIQDLRATTPLNVIPRSSSLDKQARVDGISGALESGKVLFPSDAPWLADFERELLAFPAGRHDDQVDSVTQYVTWAMEHMRTKQFEYDFFADENASPQAALDYYLQQRSYW